MAGKPILETARLRLREFDESDAEPFYVSVRVLEKLASVFEGMGDGWGPSLAKYVVQAAPAESITPTGRPHN
jgi:hypothetical protein